MVLKHGVATQSRLDYTSHINILLVYPIKHPVLATASQEGYMENFMPGPFANDWLSMVGEEARQ